MSWRVLPALVLMTSVTACAAAAPGWSPTVGVQLTTPQKLNVSVGITTIPLGGVLSSDGGLLVRLEPGLSGGKVHAGLRTSLSMVFIPMVSADMCASLLYTWNDPWGGLENDQTYLGAELRACAVPVIVSGGIYRHVAGDDTENEWVFSMGAGVGI
mgnify:CR=1 FL=1